MTLEYSDLKRLQEMLIPEDEEDTASEDDLPQSGLRKLGPANIGSVKSGQNEKENDTNDNNCTKNDSAIWDEAEVPDASATDSIADPRERPEYDIKYRQAVTPEDVYLQMGGRTPSTASCEDMVITVKLPGEDEKEVDLVVTKNRLDVSSPRYRLSLSLPQPVDTESSKAVWLEGSDLQVALRMHRELDFLNF